MHFGEHIRELRENKGLLQRQLAASLEMDTPMFSKIERGERKAKREQVIVLSKLLNEKEDTLLALWLADKVYDLIKNEKVAAMALKVVTNDLKIKE
ncbi:MAG: helix-turn-helix transcriptional regulator [Niastella sp.]|nr:helix-turn-helix transcriptional regulator [Niastella sp.]